MANSKFFNNVDTPLFEKFKGIAHDMAHFDVFQAVVGYFRSSGYFKLRKEFVNVKKIQILVGINIDDIFRKHDKSLLMLEGEDAAKKQYTEDFIRDIKEAKYSPEVEEGILQLCQDLVDGRVEMRIHKSKNLHAKFYLILPEEYNDNTDGRVIMGSSNISDSGLGVTQPPRYELNVAIRDYDDVEYCRQEFIKLWEESIPITPEDIDRIKKKTYLDHNPTPYEIFIKVLIDVFGSQVEDNFSLDLPKGYKNLRYQKDAVIQGFQMLKQYNGFFLADVVGTGKTIVAAMIAKRFVEENGKDSNILVIYPPAVENNWKDTFNDFSLKRYTQFVSNGSLDKVLEGRDNYMTSEEFDLIIVDEAHNFRSDSAERYDDLQRICKTPRRNEGFLEGTQKKVMLLSATPLNNRPEDFLNLILLFQNARNSTIEGIANLNALFSPWNQRYKKLMHDRFDPEKAKDIPAQVDELYAEIREVVLDKILVRRTRKNLVNNKDYKKDLDKQGIIFPHIEQPKETLYVMGNELCSLFGETMDMLTDTFDIDKNPNGKGLDYARYRAIEFLTGDAKQKYDQAKHVTTMLSGIYRVHMVKRLESSFYAFKQSLATFLQITNDMIKMFQNDKVIIAPEQDVKGMMAKGLELDQVIEKIVKKGYDENDFVYRADDFEPVFLDMLKQDADKLKTLYERWEVIDEDPKLDQFVELLKHELFEKKIDGKEFNKSGKLVVFSESVDTLTYLKDELTRRLNREDILFVDAANRGRVLGDIQKNFDANYHQGEQLNQYNIILTSDVLAEGVNLHRSNVIVNYDSPWNATRLMQRIGRVNRIGSVAERIYNYMFYPSAQGNKEIKLYENALIKLQGFHSALGEDAQVYSREEVLHDFQLFDENVKDNVDKQLELLREVRELYTKDRKLYHLIKALPVKSRTARKKENCSVSVETKSSLVYLSKGAKKQFYLVVADGEPQPLNFVDATDILRAKADEPVADFNAVKDVHYGHIEKALRAYQAEVESASPELLVNKRLDQSGTKAMALVRSLKRTFANDAAYDKINTLGVYIQEGIFNQLTKAFNKLGRDINKWTKDGSTVKAHAAQILPVVEDLYDNYYISEERRAQEVNTSDTLIVTSETFE